jgi:phage terminase large subunit-like protein
MDKEAKYRKACLLRERKKRLVKANFYEFFLWAWDIIVTDPLQVQPYHKYICDEVQKVAQRVINREHKEYDLIINVPPGSTKTIIVNQCLNAWLWINDPSIRLISASASHTLALESAEKTRDLITSPEFQQLFPELKLRSDSNNKANYKTSKMGQRYTTSVGATVTGVHAHIKIYDDLINVKDGYSEKIREDANKFMLHTLNSRNINANITPVILIMQRLHESDPTGVALKKWSRVKHIVLPAEISERISPPEAAELYQDGLLDPIRKPKQVLQDERLSLGSYGYAGQYEQSPAPDSGGIFKKEWFEVIDFLPSYRDLAWNFTFDTAYTKNTLNASSGLLAWAVKGHDLIIRNYEEVWFETPELNDYIPHYVEVNGYSRKSLIFVEPKANGLDVVQTVKKHTGLNIRADKAPNKDKVARARDVAPICQAGRVKLIRGAWNENFLKRVSGFPVDDLKEAVDVLGMAINNMNVNKISLGMSSN